MKEPKFNIGQRVYHILPESKVGVVVDIKYIYSSQRHEYSVVFDENTPVLDYHEHELTTHKNYN
jgi:heat shock protein HspQ